MPEIFAEPVRNHLSLFSILLRNAWYNLLPTESILLQYFIRSALSRRMHFLTNPLKHNHQIYYCFTLIFTS